MAPWSALWDRNEFLQGRPALESAVQSPYARGAVTGVGTITALAGLGELASVFALRGKRRDRPDDPVLRH